MAESEEGVFVVMRQDQRRGREIQDRAVVLCFTVGETAAGDAIDAYCMGCFEHDVPNFRPDLMQGRTPLDLDDSEWDQLGETEEWKGRVTSESFSDFGALPNAGETNRIHWPADDPQGRIVTEFFWTMAGPYIKEALLDDTPGIIELESAYDRGKGQIPPKRGGDWIPDKIREEYAGRSS